MSKPIIAFDLDDVLADSTEFWRTEVNKRTGAKLSKQHYKIKGSYSSYYEEVWQIHGIDHLIKTDDLDDQMIRDQSEVFVSTEAIEVLGELAKDYDLAIVSARTAQQSAETMKWLAANYGDIFSHVRLADGPIGINKKNKGEICKEIGASWLVDDHVDHCIAAQNNGLTGILFGEYGWQHTAPKELTRCKNWATVLEYFDGKNSA